MSTAEVSTVQIGSPLVHLRSRSGGRVIELGAQLVHSAIAVQVLALLGLLVNDGPELASWPDNVKAAWHSTGNDADQARRAYQRITEDSVIAVGTGRAKQRRREADIRELHLTATLTGCCGRPRPANLPSAFRRAPPLDS